MADEPAPAPVSAPAPGRLPDHPLVAAAQRVTEAWQVPDVGSEVLERGGSPLLATLAQTGQTFGQRVFSPLAALPPVLTTPLLKARHPGEVIGEMSPLAGALAEALYEGGVRPLSSPIGILGLLRGAASFRRPSVSPVAEGLETGDSLSTLAQKMRPFIPQPEDEVGPRPILSKAPEPSGVSTPAPTYDPALLARVEADIRAGQAGSRIFIEEPGEPGPRRVIGEPSSFPEYFQNKGLTKKGVLNVIAKAKAGKRLTGRQHAMLTDLMEGAGKDLEMEQRATRAAEAATIKASEARAEMQATTAEETAATQIPVRETKAPEVVEAREAARATLEEARAAMEKVQARLAEAEAVSKAMKRTGTEAEKYAEGTMEFRAWLALDDADRAAKMAMKRVARADRWLRKVEGGASAVSGELPMPQAPPQEASGPTEDLQRSAAARAAEAEFLRPVPPELSDEPGGLEVEDRIRNAERMILQRDPPGRLLNLQNQASRAGLNDTQYATALEEYLDQGTSPQLPSPEAAGPPPRGPGPGSVPSGLGMEVIPGLRTFTEQDILPAARATGRGLREVLTGAAKIIAPRAFAPREGVDLLGAMRATQEKANFLIDVDVASKNLERMFGAMPNHENVAFIDRYKTGAPQPTPVLQAAADFLKDIDGRLYRAKQAYAPSLAWKDNHLRVWWKDIPGAPEDVTGRLGVGRRPLEGTKGSLKRSTLPDMSEGLARGGVPVTYNPWTLFKMSMADDLKFITAQKMWEQGQDMGLIKFVKRGQRPPDGFARVHDPIARVYFHTEKGLVNPGEYFVEEGLSRLINHHLSRDWVRDSAAGWGLMQIKNLETQIELGLSGFHAVFETGESISSGMAMGLRRAFNLGVLRGQPKEFVRGLGEIVTSPTAPAALARLGGQFFRVASSAEEFVKMTHTEDFRRAFPSFDQAVDDLTAGGARLTMREPWRDHSIKAFQEALHTNNELGAIVRAPLALNETLMKPLFEWYIPRLKVGLFLREFPLRLMELEKDLASRRVTRPQVARQVWDFVEDRLGEMNFDNLYWNRTAKAAMQLLFRSVTWKLGTLRAAVGAIPEQAANIAATIRGETAFRLEPKMAWLMTLSATTAGLAIAIQKMMTGEYPKDARDLVFPRVDPKDERIRLSLPTYMKDLMHLRHSPTGYVTTSMSATASRLFEAWNNRDFYGVQVYDPNDPINVRAANILGHFFVLPFSVQSFNRMRQEGQPGWLAASGIVGITRAPAYISRTRAEEMAAHLLGRKVSGLSRTREEADHAGIKKRVLAAFRTGRQPAPEDLQAILDGRLSPQEVGRLTGRARFTPLQDMFRRLSLSEAARVFQAATPREREEVQPILLAKMRVLQNLPPSQQAEVMRTLEPLIQEPTREAAGAAAP